MSLQKTYSPAKVEVSLAGVLTLTGFAEGTSIQAARAVDNSSQTVGMQGDVGLTATANSTGTLTFTLMQNSESNLAMSVLQNAQDLAKTLFRFGVTVSDPSGGFLCHAEGCHVMTPAEMSLGDTQESKVWVLFVEDLRFFDAERLKAVGAATALSKAKNAVDQLRAISGNRA
jgi:hypothetical protein